MAAEEGMARGPGAQLGRPGCAADQLGDCMRVQEPPEEVTTCLGAESHRNE